MKCAIDLSKLLYGRRSLVPCVTSTSALVVFLVAAYSCKLVRVDRREGLSPFFVGVWKVEGGVAAGQGFLDNTNECIAWTDTPFFQDGGVRAAKFFSILATLLGTVVWTLIATAAVTRQPLGLPWRITMLAGSCACAVMSVMLFCTFAADVCQQDDLTCHFGAASYLSLTATILWTVTGVLSFLWTQSTTLTHTSTRDLVTIATTHSTPTVPTGRAMRTTEYRHGTHRESVNETLPDKDNSSSHARDTEDPWHEGAPPPAFTSSSSRSSPHRSSPVDLDEEVGIDDMPPIGSPLISITEDEQGNLIKTTITRTVDSQGRTIIDRTSQRIEDNDKAETASV